MLYFNPALLRKVADSPYNDEMMDRMSKALGIPKEQLYRMSEEELMKLFAQYQEKTKDDPDSLDTTYTKNSFLGLEGLSDNYGISQGIKDVQDWWGGQGDAASAAGNRALAYFAPKLVGALGFGAVASMLAGRKGGVMVPLLGAIGGFLAGGPIFGLLKKMFGTTPKPPGSESNENEPPISEEEIEANRSQLDNTKPNELSIDQKQLKSELSEEDLTELEKMLPEQQKAVLNNILADMAQNNPEALAGLRERANENPEWMNDQEKTAYGRYTSMRDWEKQQQEDADYRGYVDRQMQDVGEDGLPKALTAEEKQAIASTQFNSPEERNAAIRKALEANIEATGKAKVARDVDEAINSMDDRQKQQVFINDVYAKWDVKTQQAFDELEPEEQQLQADEYLKDALTKRAQAVQRGSYRADPFTQQERERIFHERLSTMPEPTRRALEREYNNANEDQKKEMLMGMVDDPYHTVQDTFENDVLRIYSQPYKIQENVAAVDDKGNPIYTYEIDPSSLNIIKSAKNPNGIDIDTPEGKAIFEKLRAGKLSRDEINKYYYYNYEDPTYTPLNPLNPVAPDAYKDPYAEENYITDLYKADIEASKNARQVQQMRAQLRDSREGEWTPELEKQLRARYAKYVETMKAGGYKVPDSEAMWIAKQKRRFQAYGNRNQQTGTTNTSNTQSAVPSTQPVAPAPASKPSNVQPTQPTAKPASTQPTTQPPAPKPNAPVDQKANAAPQPKKPEAPGTK